MPWLCVFTGLSQSGSRGVQIEIQILAVYLFWNYGYEVFDMTKLGMKWRAIAEGLVDDLLAKLETSVVFIWYLAFFLRSGV